MRHDLTSGAWVEYRPVQDLKTKDKDALTRVTRFSLPPGLTMEALDSPAELDLASLASGMNIMEFQLTQRDAIIARVVTGWSFTGEDGGPLPVPRIEGDEIADRAAVGEIPLGDFAELEELIAPHAAALRRRPDPKGATTSSSNGLSRAKAGGSRPA